MPWGLIIVAFFVCIALGFGIPNIVTGSTSVELLIQNNSMLIAGGVFATILVIAIWGSRH